MVIIKAVTPLSLSFSWIGKGRPFSWIGNSTAMKASSAYTPTWWDGQKPKYAKAKKKKVTKKKGKKKNARKQR